MMKEEPIDEKDIEANVGSKNEDFDARLKDLQAKLKAADNSNQLKAVNRWGFAVAEFLSMPLLGDINLNHVIMALAFIGVVFCSILCFVTQGWGLAAAIFGLITALIVGAEAMAMTAYVPQAKVLAKQNEVVTELGGIAKIYVLQSQRWSEQIQQSKAQIKERAEQLNISDRQMDHLKSQIRELESQISQGTKQIHERGVQLTELTEEVSKLKGLNRGLLDVMSNNFPKITERLQQIESESTVNLTEAAKTLAQTEKIRTQLQTTQEKLSETQDKLSVTQDKLSETQEKLVNTGDDLKHTADRVKGLVSELHAQIQQEHLEDFLEELIALCNGLDLDESARENDADFATAIVEKNQVSNILDIVRQMYSAHHAGTHKTWPNSVSRMIGVHRQRSFGEMKAEIAKVDERPEGDSSVVKEPG